MYPSRAEDFDGRHWPSLSHNVYVWEVAVNFTNLFINHNYTGKLATEFFRKFGKSSQKLNESNIIYTLKPLLKITTSSFKRSPLQFPFSSFVTRSRRRRHDDSMSKYLSADIVVSMSICHICPSNVTSAEWSDIGCVTRLNKKTRGGSFCTSETHIVSFWGQSTPDFSHIDSHCVILIIIAREMIL